MTEDMVSGSGNITPTWTPSFGAGGTTLEYGIPGPSTGSQQPDLYVRQYLAQAPAAPTFVQFDQKKILLQ
jgi:hypothetical protein